MPPAGTIAALLLFLLLQQDSLQNTRIGVESNLVVVPALVMDQNRECIFGLQAGDFVIEDNGVAQTAQLEEDVDFEPISLVLAVQTGRSAKAEFERIQGLFAMLEPVISRANTRVALVTFDSEVTLAQGFTTDTTQIERGLKALHRGDDGSAILRAVKYSTQLLSREAKVKKRVLLIISETRDHGSAAVKLDDVISSIQSTDILVYALSFGPALSNVLDDLRGKLEPKSDHVDLGVLLMSMAELTRQALRLNTPKTIAYLTGGEYELFKSRSGFEEYMAQFANHLFGRYTLTFVPKQPTPGLHFIRVRVPKLKDAHVVARTTYWARGHAERQ